MKQIFVLPTDRRTASGGNLYNRFLLRALRDAGVELSVMSIDEAIRDAERRRPSRYWLDSLLLDRMAGFRPLVRSPSECYVIVHYFPSLQSAAPTRIQAALRCVEDAAFRSADGFLLTSAFSARELASRNTGNKAIVLVPPAPVVAPGGKPRRRRPGFNALMAASLVSDKGIAEFLESLGRRLSPDDEYSLEIAGRMDVDTTYASRCCRVVDASAVLRDKVRFLGALGLRAMKQAYERNGFFISSSRMETFGMALQEARMFGMYVLTLDAGNAAAHVATPGDGEVLASISALSGRVAQLIGNAPLRDEILKATVPSPSHASATWSQAAMTFLEQSPMPQRRMA